MNKPLILVVEDDKPVRNLITTTLKTNNYKFITAENGASALIEVTSHNPEIMLLDLGLPDMDGIDVINRIRSWSNMPIIVISARSEDRDKIDALDSGADDYLTKPFSVEELLARIRVAQRRLSIVQAEKQSQMGSPEKRRANVSGAYRPADPELVDGKRILLIDDIVTTGATLSECAKTLLAAGAKEVLCAAVARTRE